MTQSLIELKQITKLYEAQQNTNHVVLEDIDLIVQEGEFVTILGPSGSGKSTLLHIIAGLTQMTRGTVSYLGQSICGANPGASMVRQSFALFPWLTVLENVIVGLENIKIPSKEKKLKALQIIEMLGLDRVVNAYPKELSDEMRQRVGLGRALVSDPAVLLMDEPFSLLDVLSAENLQQDILKLWLNKKIMAKSIIMVTHDIDEAVYMSDRVVILSSGPGKIVKDIRIDIPRLRDKKDPVFLTLVDQIHFLMTKQIAETVKAVDMMDTMQLTMLPNISNDALTGFLKLLSELNEKNDLYKLAEQFMMDTEELFPIVDGVALLGFAQIQEGGIELTEAGRQYARASILERKELFCEQLLRYVPMISQMLRFVESNNNNKMNIECFEDILNGYFSKEQTKGQLETLIRWGRYAELFAYDDKSRQFYIEQAGE